MEEVNQMPGEDIQSVIGNFERWGLHNLRLDSRLTLKARRSWLALHGDDS
jgi:hypothetical protein